MKIFLTFLLLIAAVCDVCGARPEMISSDHPVRFFRTDPIDLPAYSWPRTLVSYPLIFDSSIGDGSKLDLHDNISGGSVDFQLSDKKYSSEGRLESAVINFFAMLPRGGSYDYTLYNRNPEKSKVESTMRIQREGDRWILGNERFSVAVPVGGRYDSHMVPAPILGIADDGVEIGSNVLRSSGVSICDVTTSVVEEGPLYAECKVTYSFSNGASYVAKVKTVDGYPFVILDEEISGLTPSDSVSIDMEWSNFNPTRRYGNWDRQKEVSVDGGLPIDRPIHTNWCQEDPHWTGEGWIEKPSERMLYRLLPFAGNSSREQVPAITFWETGDNARELGVFVYDHNRWNDLDYNIWQPGTGLCVYFRYTDGLLHFTYPLTSGSRSTAITLYDIKGKEDVVEAFNSEVDDIASRGGADSSKEMGFRYGMMLHRQYGLLNLDVVKDWQLEYPADGTHPSSPFEKREKNKTPEEFYKAIVTSPMSYYMTGLNSFPGIHSISHRPVFGTWVQDYLECAPSLTSEQRRTVDALFLLAGYVNTLESMNSIRHALAGTANMAADGWAVPGQMSFLYPDHPMAREWADFFEACIRTYGIFYTRPDVAPYESKGGRWVESLGIYNWAYLRPTGATNTALIEYDGRNRFADPNMAARGRWMLDMMTAPVSLRRKGTSEEYGRAYPPHGAHGGGRIVPRYCQVRQLADWMVNYDPILAEGLYWTGPLGPAVEAKPGQTDWRSLHVAQFGDFNIGTNPHLKSAKYTGHGIVLRAGVDTDDELSIHLNQVDKGPNYRWGHQGQGNSGGLYFYAGGKIYNGHENEAVGDHMQNNLDGVTNFGVMKDGAFHNIGMNELKAPLYDLGIVQLAELRSVEGEGSFAWPEYLSRSVMLVGTDYFLLYDETGTNWRAGARFSWFTNKEDEYPKIVFFGKKARPDHWSKGETLNSRGFYRDADGSLLTLVSHKKDGVDVVGGKSVTPKLLEGSSVYEFVPDNGEDFGGVVYIRAPHSDDIVFRNGNGISLHGRDEGFEGEAGVIRRMDDGSLQLALMKGTAIYADGLRIRLDGPGTALAVTRTAPDRFYGRFKSDGKGVLSIEGMKGGRLYIDGIRQKGMSSISLPEGEHAIEYGRDAAPMAASISSAVYGPEGTRLTIDIPATADKAEVEVSADGGKSWRMVGVSRDGSFMLPLLDEPKVHVRAVAVKGDRKARQTMEYPVYRTSEAPHYPEGLRLMLGSDTVSVSWGKVLGVEAYRLYRRKTGEKSFTLVYEGPDCETVDTDATGVIPAYELPGTDDNASRNCGDHVIYEYAVSAVNGFGEGNLSDVLNTDPASWLNWYPATDLRYKRRSAFWMPPYVPESEMPEKYYPVK